MICHRLNCKSKNSAARSRRLCRLWCILARGQRVVGNCSETSRSLLSTEQTGTHWTRSRIYGKASIYFIEMVRRFVSIRPFIVIRPPRRCIVVVVEVLVGVWDVISVVALVDASLFCERKRNFINWNIYLAKHN